LEPAAEQTLWARDTAAALLAPLGQRCPHTLGVVERVRTFADRLTTSEFDALVAAAYAHDVGYAPALARTGFHGSTALVSCDQLAGSAWLAWLRTIPARTPRPRNAACSTHSSSSPRSARWSPTF